jgi:hypothetical protein
MTKEDFARILKPLYRVEIEDEWHIAFLKNSEWVFVDEKDKYYHLSSLDLSGSDVIQTICKEQFGMTSINPNRVGEVVYSNTSDFKNHKIRAEIKELKHRIAHLEGQLS